MHDLVRRCDATQKTLAKYRGKAFDWESGVTCVHLARFHLRAMGHKPQSLPRIASLIAAKRALSKRGWGDCGDMFDTILPRISPASMLLGDLAVAPSSDGLGAIFVCAGPLKLLGWHDDAAELVVVDADLSALLGAWRG